MIWILFYGPGQLNLVKINPGISHIELISWNLARIGNDKTGNDGRGPGRGGGGGRHLSTFQFECFNYVTVTQFMQNLTIFKI